MYTYEAKKFTVPALEGISEEGIKQHIALYEGYVKNFNAISALLNELSKDEQKNALALSELMRRRSFEFGGMRLHEHYFTQFEGGAKAADTLGAFAKAIAPKYGSIDQVITMMKAIASMRGPGWALLYYDKEANEFLSGFSGEQHLGHLVTLPILLALDVWEHAYILDYGASGKGKYVDAFFKNLNWGVVERRFEQFV